MKKIIVAVFALALAPVFAADSASQLIVKAVEEATGWTSAELTNGLNLINSVWRREMKTPQGRVRWCGPVVKVEHDTNTLEKVTVYENGHRHVQKFSSVRAMGIKEKLSAEELKARREAARKAAEAERERRRLERISYIVTNFSGAVAAVMKGKNYPEPLADLLVKHEYNQLVGTNVVTVTFTPE